MHWEAPDYLQTQYTYMTHTTRVKIFQEVIHVYIIEIYGILVLSQHWLRQWLHALWHQAIVSTNIDLSLIKLWETFLF